jgi:hypothetical protein
VRNDVQQERAFELKSSIWQFQIWWEKFRAERIRFITIEPILFGSHQSAERIVYFIDPILFSLCPNYEKIIVYFTTIKVRHVYDREISIELLKYPPVFVVAAIIWGLGVVWFCVCLVGGDLGRGGVPCAERMRYPYIFLFFSFFLE